MSEIKLRVHQHCSDCGTELVYEPFCCGGDMSGAPKCELACRKPVELEAREAGCICSSDLIENTGEHHPHCPFGGDDIQPER